MSGIQYVTGTGVDVSRSPGREADDSGVGRAAWRREIAEMQRRGRRDSLMIALGDALEELKLTPEQVKDRVRQLLGGEY